MSYITAGNLTREQIAESVKEIIKPFKNNSLPQLRLQNKGEYKQLTEEEIAISCSSVYEDIWQNNGNDC